MARAFGSLGDFFPDTEFRCRIRGCQSVWQESGEAALQNVARGREARPERMCDRCYSRFLELEDKPIPCSQADCDKTWVWNRFQQLEAEAQGRKDPPRGMCSSCRKTLNTIEDRDMPCRIKGCANTWTWTARSQFYKGAESPPERMCDSCYQALKSFQDIEAPCRIHGCDQVWLFSRYQQLEWQVAGKDTASPPKRMCQRCFDLFRTCDPREVPCRVSNCDRTWTFRPFDRVAHRIQNGPDAPPPERMCNPCYRFYQSAVDREITCRTSGCRNTWLYTRSMQLHLHAKGVTRTPSRMCERCVKRLAELEARELPCQVAGCDRTWTYSPDEQLRDGVARRPSPRPRRCQRCESFLHDATPQTIACSECGRDIQWSTYEQLLATIGTFVRPSRCANCTEQELEHERTPPAVVREHHHVVRMPAAGRWHEIPRIRDWPPRLTHDTLEAAEKTDARLVVLGDDLFLSDPDVAASWPALLEQQIRARPDVPDDALVVNAGIPGSTSAEGVLRAPRDVYPFAPQAVLFGFAYADSRVHHRTRDDTWPPAIPIEEAMEAVERLTRSFRKRKIPAVCLLPNPLLPRAAAEWDTDRRPNPAWERAQHGSSDHYLRALRQCCQRLGLPYLDLTARFEVNGMRSARKWMTNWHMHNGVGAANIARWVAEFLNHEGLV